MKREPIIFIQHILESIEDIEEFIKGVDKDSLAKNKEKQSAIIRQIEIIGEATKNIPQNIKRKYSSIPWKEIIGTRDKLIHHYFGVDLNILWKILEKDIPKLKQEIKDIIKKEKSSK